MQLEVKVPRRGITDSFNLMVNIANPVSYRTLQARLSVDQSIVGYIPAIHRGDKFQRYYPIHLAERNVKIPREDKMVDASQKAIHSLVSDSLISVGGLGGYSISRVHDATFYPDRFPLAVPITAGEQLKRTAAKGVLGILATIFR